MELLCRRMASLLPRRLAARDGQPLLAFLNRGPDHSRSRARGVGLWPHFVDAVPERRRRRGVTVPAAANQRTALPRPTARVPRDPRQRTRSSPMRREAPARTRRSIRTPAGLLASGGPLAFTPRRRRPRQRAPGVIDPAPRTGPDRHRTLGRRRQLPGEAANLPRDLERSPGAETVVEGLAGAIRLRETPGRARLRGDRCSW